MKVIKFDEVAKKIVLQRDGCQETIIRHPDDVKLYGGGDNTDFQPSKNTEADLQIKLPEDDDVEKYNGVDEEGDWSPFAESDDVASEVEAQCEEGPRRSTRTRVPNSRYVNAYFVSK